MEKLHLEELLLMISAAALMVSWSAYLFLFLRIRKDQWDSRMEERSLVDLLRELAERQREIYEKSTASAGPAD